MYGKWFINLLPYKNEGIRVSHYHYFTVFWELSPYVDLS
jgi:hypothetical protein